jgi:predicted alpha/beta superfamily hydrolase
MHMIAPHSIGHRVYGESIAGHVRIHVDFPSSILGNHRSIVVYLPPSYEHDPRRYYPVFYLQDGQNVFDARTAAFGVEWGFDETAEKLVHRRKMEEIIMVGVYNTPGRNAEYTPDWSGRHGLGQIEPYGRFLVEELMPFIASTYRVLPAGERTGVVGSSLGGLCSLYLSLRYPHVFRRVGGVSPSLYFGNGHMFRWFAEYPPMVGPERIWLCAGALEGRPPRSTYSFAIAAHRRLKQVLLDKGYIEGENLFCWEAPTGRHNERSWAKRVPYILQCLYPRI